MVDGLGGPGVVTFIPPPAGVVVGSVVLVIGVLNVGELGKEVPLPLIKLLKLPDPVVVPVVPLDAVVPVPVLPLVLVLVAVCDFFPNKYKKSSTPAIPATIKPAFFCLSFIT